MNIGTYDDAQPDGLSRNSQIGLMGFRTDYIIHNLFALLYHSENNT